VDTTPPTITAPPDLSVSADAGACTATLDLVALGAPVVDDNCTPGIVPVPTVGGSPIADPFTFPQGDTTVTWVADDGCNVSTADQLVTVESTSLVDLTVELLNIESNPPDSPQAADRDGGG